MLLQMTSFHSFWWQSNIALYAAAAAASLQLCPTLCNPIDGSPSGSPIPGILQARTLEWVAISFSNAWKWRVKVKLLSRVRLLATPWTTAYQALPSMGFSRQEYWSGCRCLLQLHCLYAFRMFPCLGYCKECCPEHRGTCVLLNWRLSISLLHWGELEWIPCL